MERFFEELIHMKREEKHFEQSLETCTLVDANFISLLCNKFICLLDQSVTNEFFYFLKGLFKEF